MTEEENGAGATLAIARAEVRDAEELSGLATRTFRAAFGEQNTESDMELYVAEAFSLERVAQELADRSNLFLLARPEPESAAIGYAKLRPGPPPARMGNVEGLVVGDDDPIELQRLYLDTAAIGTGLGSALMEECVTRAAKAGHTTLWLGVWERNERAIDFYRRWGLRPVGAHDFVLGSDPQRDLIMQRPLAVESAGRPD